MFCRRDAIRIGVCSAAGALSTGTAALSSHAESPEHSHEIVDTNVHLFRWPFRRLPLDQTDRLVAKFRSLGVTKAWAGSFEGIFHRDITSVNERLAKQCALYRELVPIGCINPTLPDWKTDLRICLDQHRVQGVRLYPNYHGYTLRDGVLTELFQRVADSDRFIQLVVSMEDSRTQHLSMRVEDVDLGPLPDLMASVPAIRVQMLNWRPTITKLKHLTEVDRLFFDTARVEGTDGVPQLVERAAPGRVMLGSHAPFLIPEAALIRVHESGQLDRAAVAAVMAGNAAVFEGAA